MLCTGVKKWRKHMKTESKLDNWVIGKIKAEYKDDVALLIGHNSYRLEEYSLSYETIRKIVYK
jgi:hypothetical protein